MSLLFAIEARQSRYFCIPCQRLYKDVTRSIQGRAILDGSGGVAYCFAFVRFQPHVHLQNALKRVGLIQRAQARFGISDTEFIRWPWWGRKTIRYK